MRIAMHYIMHTYSMHMHVHTHPTTPCISSLCVPRACPIASCLVVCLAVLALSCRVVALYRSLRLSNRLSGSQCHYARSMPVRAHQWPVMPTSCPSAVCALPCPRCLSAYLALMPRSFQFLFLSHSRFALTESCRNHFFSSLLSPDLFLLLTICIYLYINNI